MIKQSILLCLAFAAAIAPTHIGAQNRGPTLTLADRGKFHTLTRDALLARPDVVQVTIARDPMYGGASMSYRAVPAAALLADLAVGADDYVPKPCMPRELTARVRAILRRTQASMHEHGQATFAVGALVVHPGRRVVEWQGKSVSLTSTEYKLLEVLARHGGQPVSKQDLSEQGLGRPLTRFDRSVDVHLSSIRQKLAGIGTLADGRSCIQTVYRLGYQLIRE